MDPDPSDATPAAPAPPPDSPPHAEDQLINFTDWPLMLREDIRRQLAGTRH
jgi:hypothetical protein